MLSKLNSRKLMVALAAIAGFLYMGGSGALGWDVASERIQYVALGYLAAEGGPDAAGALGNVFSELLATLKGTNDDGPQ